MESLQFANLRIPGFVKEDYPKFTSFMKAYYEWLSDGPGRLNVNNFRDIDETIDVFVEAFKEEYLADFPSNFKGDIKLFLKHHLDFYKSKGSEESLRFLFRLLFDSEIEIEYPRDLIFTSSEGVWKEQISIKIDTADERVDEVIGKYVFGETSFSLAYIENTYRYVSGGVSVTELVISDIKGQFAVDETVTINLPDGHVISGTVVPAITEFNITNAGLYYKRGDQAQVTGGDLLCSVNEVSRGSVDGVAIDTAGTGYTLNDTITLTDPAGKGTGAQIVITAVGGSGEITEVTLIRKGNGYEQLPIVEITGGTNAVLTLSSTTIGKIKSFDIQNHGVYTGGLPTVDLTGIGDGNATVTAVKGAMCYYPGKYESIKSFVSDITKIQDGEKYQPYSYVIKSGQSVNQYRDVLKKLVHPAGMLQLAEIFIEETVHRESHTYGAIGHNGGKLLKDIVILWETISRNNSANLVNHNDLILFQEVSYTVPSKSNVMMGIDWHYKFTFTTRQIKGFVDEPISNYTFTSDRAYSIAGTAIVGTITVGYDRLRVPVPVEFPFIELGNPGRGMPGYGVAGIAIVGSNSGRKQIIDTWGDVIADVSKTNIQADAEVTLLP